LSWFNDAWIWLAEQFRITFIVRDRYKLFLEGFRNTLVIALGAVIIGIIIGTLVAFVRVYGAKTAKERKIFDSVDGKRRFYPGVLLMKVLNKICGAYLAIFRGTPIVVQLLIMFFIVFKSVDNGVLIAVLSFGINSGAYVAEMVRAGIMSIDIGQTEAGRSLGLTSPKTMLLIVFPQAVKNILPAFGNEFVSLLKETSVAGYVTVRDLTKAAENVRSETMEPYFSLLFVAFVYFLLVLGITKLLRLVERRLSKSDRG